MTTYIFILLMVIVFLLLVLVFRKNTVDMSGLREDNARLRERLAERLGMLSQNAIELKNISGDIANFKNINWQALVLGLVSIVILVIWPKINKTIPNSFVALVIGTAATYFLKLDVALLGDIPKTISVAKIEGVQFDDSFKIVSNGRDITRLYMNKNLQGGWYRKYMSSEELAKRMS